MQTIEPRIEILIDKLSIAVALYQKAAQRVHNDMLKEQFMLQAERKQTYIGQLAHQLDLHLEEHQISIADRIKLQMEKMGIEIDHAYLRQNARETLSFCLKREEELIDAYRGLMSNSAYDSHLKFTLKSQFDDSVRLKDELSTLYEQYDFQEA